MKAERACLPGISAILVTVLAACGGSNSAGNSNNSSGNGGSSGSGGGSSLKSVNHVVVMVQENRSFDHYFGFLNSYRASQGASQDVDGMPASASNIGYDGHTVIPAFHLATECTEDLSSFWNESHVDWNLEDPTSNTPKMDGFAHSAGHFATDENLAGRGPYTDTNGFRAMGYYTSDDLPYYYFMATQFGTSDRWFSPVGTRTQPNRMYLFAATSQGHVYPPTGSLTAKTIFADLDAAGVSWKIYETDPGDTYLTYFQPYASQHMGNVVPASQFVQDANNGTLPAVAFIEGGYNSGRDEHPTTPIQKGEMYVTSLINGLVQSPSWKDSVFFLTWDEGGGFYDHVPPVGTVNPDGIAPVDLQPTDFPGDFTRTGFRVPLIVISPFAKKNYVSHTAADYTAMLKFIETRWSLPNLTKRDAAQPDMTEFFDWSAPNANPPTAPTPAETLRCTPSQMQ
jgi:phospholipase C